MTFDPDEKLIELFKKHMKLPDDESDEVLQRSFEHNLEYCGWYVQPDGKIRIGSDGSYKGQFLPLGFHHGQDDAMRRVENDFIIYLSLAREHGIACVAAAVKRMQDMGVVPASIQVPKIWTSVLPYKVFGLDCNEISKTGEKPRIFSEAKYGRFVEFTF